MISLNIRGRIAGTLSLDQQGALLANEAPLSVGGSGTESGASASRRRVGGYRGYMASLLVRQGAVDEQVCDSRDLCLTCHTCCLPYPYLGTVVHMTLTG
jgi:hypothetical protein